MLYKPGSTFANSPISLSSDETTLDCLKDDMVNYLTGLYGITHGSYSGYEEIEVTWESGKVNQSWASAGQILGDYQEEKGSFVMKETGQRINYKGKFYTTFNSVINVNDRLSIDGVWLRVVYIQDFIDHDVLYLDSVEGEN